MAVYFVVKCERMWRYVLIGNVRNSNEALIFSLLSIWRDNFLKNEAISLIVYCNTQTTDQMLRKNSYLKIYSKSWDI